MTKSNNWTLTVETGPENGDCILQLPADLLQQAGWREGDYLHWIDMRDGSWQLVKEELTTFIKSGIMHNEQN